MSGLAAARLAAAGVVGNSGTAALSLGSLLGSFDPAALTDGLGDDWQIAHNYFKRHACARTRTRRRPGAAAAERTLAGLTAHQVADAVTEMRVETHALAAPLDRTRWDGPLGAMFSIPTRWPPLLDGAVARHRGGDPGRQTRTLRPRREGHRTRGPHPDRPAAARAPPGSPRSSRRRAPGAVRAPPGGRRSHHPFTARTLPGVLTGLLGDEALVEYLRRAANHLPRPTTWDRCCGTSPTSRSPRRRVLEALHENPLRHPVRVDAPS